MKRIKTLASIMALSLSCNVLIAQTYYLQSMGGTDGPPYPWNPSPDSPTEQVGPDAYVVADSDSMDTGGMMMASGFTMSAASLDPSDPGTNSPNGPDGPTPPNIRNYAKYGAQQYSILDTNSVLNELNDTNLYNACAAMRGPTNGLPLLTIAKYGSAGVIIRADNFDYSQTNVDLALLVCDKVQTPTWKAIDFDGVSDAQDGWLVQGQVLYDQVTSTMFFQVTNLNLTYPAFFKVIPYAGPQVAIAGTNQPFATVSNIIGLTAQIYDLTGTTNEQFMVDVNGSPRSTRVVSVSGNTFVIDTKYCPNGQDYGMDNVSLTVQGFPSVYSHTTNGPGDVLTRYNVSGSIPLDFENVNYLLMQGALCDREIGTNAILFVSEVEEDVSYTITHPGNNQIVASGGGHVVGPTVIEIDWNMTEADHVTPYSESRYNVNVHFSDPNDYTLPNNIESNDEVRRPAGCMITYQNLALNINGLGFSTYINEEEDTWLVQAEAAMYDSIYTGNTDGGLTEYTTDEVGDSRNYEKCEGITFGGNHDWSFLGWDFAQTYSNSIDGLFHPKLSDLTLGAAHGNGLYIGGGGQGEIYFPTVQPLMSPANLEFWLKIIGNDWRLRKVAIFSCAAGTSSTYSPNNQGPNGETNGTTLDFATASGIRPQDDQIHNYVRKNSGWMTAGECPFQNYPAGGGAADSAPKVANLADELWVVGANLFPGGQDPTYSSFWVVDQIRGMYPQDMGAPKGLREGSTLRLFGYPWLPYTSIYDDILRFDRVCPTCPNNHYMVKHPGVP